LGDRRDRLLEDRVRGPDATSLGVRQAERDIGRRPGLTTDARARFKQLERENVEAPAYD